MPDDYKYPKSKASLGVVQPNDKVEQLRHAFSESGGPKPLAHEPAPATSLAPELAAVRQQVIDVLRTIYDPELPIDIYELGLIYVIDVADDRSVHVKMTLTAPACPVAGTLPGEVERKIETIPDVTSAKVELVWEPKWTKDRLSEAALLELGLL